MQRQSRCSPSRLFQSLSLLYPTLQSILGQGSLVERRARMACKSPGHKDTVSGNELYVLQPCLQQNHSGSLTLGSAGKHIPSASSPITRCTRDGATAPNHRRGKPRFSALLLRSPLGPLLRRPLRRDQPPRRRPGRRVARSLLAPSHPSLAPSPRPKLLPTVRG
ncbi:uncharacterized protein LY79DRAFT_569382 [Colletotrichum navitas]|uniref:Uncharacterized protein n=1 Tax=Colletotrichum navitas TaxID=681940 RepID=A0AAD8V095_9PEZI|nr:uncharacterized protein LY79DRAFT_569382 [Colletotrichum navitas]KAK1572985.1 hypothetical protein LY79DRAFT_569382 [Colletotrichum navitas]